MAARSDQDEEKAGHLNKSASAPGKSQSAFEQLRHLLPDGPTVKISEDHLQSVLTVRRGREALFGRHLFSDPAWDVILELYAARLAKRRMSASDLARAIGAPASVIERWISTLIEARVVRSDPDETQELTIMLTEDGAAKMERLVNQWTSAFFAI